MKKCFLLWAVMFVLLSVHVTHALVQVDVLSPTTCIRGTGEPVTETFTFPGVSGPATVKLTNGSLKNGSIEKVSSSIVTVNGQVVFGSSEFNQNVGYLEKAINLSERQNILEVLLKGKPGGQVTIQIIQEVEAEGAAVVGPGGGVVEVTDSESELFRTRIDLPGGALSQNTLIVINEVYSPAVLPDDKSPAGPSIEFTPDVTSFLSNIRISMPYNDSDDDGIVDYTGATEDDIELITYDENQGSWHSVAFFEQDKLNNLITFETNHFSIYRTVIKPIDLSTDTFIFTIPGMRLFNTFLSEITPLWDHGLSFRDSYLQEAFVKEMNLGLTYGDVYSYRWDGYAESTPERVEELVVQMKEQYCKAKKNKKRFIMVTHSWGTVLGTLALQYAPQVIPDLLITLSSPLGSNNIDLFPSFLFCYEPVLRTVGEIQNLIEGYVREKTQLTEEHMSMTPSGIRCHQWINYWDTGDIISGPVHLLIFPPQDDPPFEDREVLDGISVRSCTITRWVHALTSLNEKQFEEYSDDPQIMNQLRLRIVEDIFSAGNFVDSDCDGILDDGDASGTPGDNPCTGGNTFRCDDNCPNTYNPDQADSDGNGIGDACEAPQLTKWERTYGSTGFDTGYSVQQTMDGGYVIAGIINSTDLYLIKTDSNGNEIWSNTFQGNDYCWLFAI